MFGHYGWAFAISFVAAFAVGLVLVPLMRRLKAGQTIREDGPVWHNKKQGTPTMGGLMFIAGVIAAVLIAGFKLMREGNFTHIYILLFALANAAIGFVDDFVKLKKKRNLGLTAKQKFLMQLAVALLFVLLLRLNGTITAELYIPFFNVTVNVPETVYFAFAAFVTVGTVNAVNITDGADGLATGVSLPAALCIAVVSGLWGADSAGVFSSALFGGLLAFLCFNFHPAEIFMGDTGAHFLGGAICALALALNMPLALIPLGIVFILEALSDIIQVLYFRRTHGKRFFKMAPLHHHLEMSGWSERRLFTVFTGVSLIFAVITFLGLVDRYGV